MARSRSTPACAGRCSSSDACSSSGPRRRSCRIGNEPQDFHLSPHEVESKARDRLEAYPTRFGSKELIDPDKGRKVFQQIEKKAQHQFARYSRPLCSYNMGYFWAATRSFLRTSRTHRALCGSWKTCLNASFP